MIFGSGIVICLLVFCVGTSSVTKEKTSPVIQTIQSSTNKTTEEKPLASKLTRPSTNNTKNGTKEEAKNENKEVKEVKALSEDSELEIDSLTKENNTAITTAKNTTKSTSKAAPKKITLNKVKTEKQKPLKIIDEKTKEMEGSGSGTGFYNGNSTETNDSNKKHESEDKGSKEKPKSSKEKKGDKNKDVYDAEYSEPSEDGEFNYNDEYYGGEGQGYEYNNNNGAQTSKEYTYGFNHDGGPPIVEGQSFDMKQQQPSDSSVSETPQGSFDPYQALADSSPDSAESDSMSPSQDIVSNNNEGMINSDQGIGTMTDDESVPTEYGDYEKKTKTNKIGKKRTKLHRKFNQARHKHVMKAKKSVTTQTRFTDAKGYKRTIMIGNRICGSKKSTNIHTLQKKDEIHMTTTSKAEETTIKKEQPSVIRATDQCCAEHYECPRIVPAKSAKYGYQNDIEYDVMGCSCDTKFRNCLKNANSYTADAVGHLYFNTLKIPCLTFEQELPEPKSEQPSPDSMNVVSVVPDAETERESVGGAQLVVSQRNIHKDNIIEHDKQQVANKQPKKELVEERPDRQLERQPDRQQERQEIQDIQQNAPMQQQSGSSSQMSLTTNRSKETQKEDEEQEEQSDGRKNKRPDIMNPNPSPSNPNPYGGKIRGVVNIPEAYLPKVSITH